MNRKVVVGLLLCCSACTPQTPPTGLRAIQDGATWTKAREFYFHTNKSPALSYAVDGVTGEIVDVHVYSCPRRDLVVVTYGETYQNTTGWDVHVVLMKTNDVPAYPGNIYFCPNGANFAIDWVNDDTLGIFYPAGYYPDKRDPKTGEVSKFPDFQYEKEVRGITVRFIPADAATMDAKEQAMNTKDIKANK